MHRLRDLFTIQSAIIFIPISLNLHTILPIFFFFFWLGPHTVMNQWGIPLCLAIVSFTFLPLFQ